MKKLQISAVLTSLIALSVMAIFAVGCKKEESPVKETTTPVTGDLYPLTIGHQLVYGGYLRDAKADTNITATGSVYTTKWTVMSNAYPSPVGGGTAHLVMDSTTVPTGVTTPPTITVATPLLAKRTTATGSADIYLLQNFATLFDQTGVTRKPASGGVDTVYYLLLVNMSKNVSDSWSAFDSTWTAASGAKVRLLITAKWEAKEDYTARDNVKYSTYRLSTTRSVYLNGQLSSGGPTAMVWFSPGVGPVKMVLNADGVSTSGHFRELKSKNFTP